MSLTLDYLSSSPQMHNNLCVEAGFDPSCVAWSDDAHVREEISRLLAFGMDHKAVGSKTLISLDLSNEPPFDLSTAVFEDMHFEDLKLPKGTNLSNARFIGCNVLDVNFRECITE